MWSDVYQGKHGKMLSILASAILVLPSCVPTKEQEKTIVSLPSVSVCAKNILFIGDSYSASVFGSTLTTMMEQKIPGSRVTAIASCGSASGWWLSGRATPCGFWQHHDNGSEENRRHSNTPKIDELIQSLHPATIVVALGANLIPQKPIDRLVESAILMQSVTSHQRQCFWIGPPDARKFSAHQREEVYHMLSQLANGYGCHLIDSRDYTHYPATGRDGLHYSGKDGEAIARDWAVQVFKHNLQKEILAYQRAGSMSCALDSLDRP